MADDAMRKNPKSRLIRRIAISGIAITVVVFISAILISRRSEYPDLTPLPLPPPVVTPGKGQPQLQKCTLFFFDTESLTLAGEERELHLSQDIAERLKQTITELLTDSINGLYETIPNGTFLYEVYVDDQLTAYLDFSRHLKDGHIGGTTAETLTVGAILRTVEANFPDEIRKVQVLIEGLEADTLAGHINISKPLALSLEAVSEVAEPEGAQGETLEDGK